MFQGRKRIDFFGKLWSRWRPPLGGFPQAQKITGNLSILPKSSHVGTGMEER